MSLGDNARSLAKRLLDKYGADGTLVSRTMSYNASTGRAAASATSTTAVKVTPPAPLRQFRGDQANGASSGVRANFRCFLAALDLSIVPTAANHTLEFGGRGYTIVEVRPIYSGPDVALYELDLEA